VTQPYPKPDAIEVAFDDENLVANAGLLLVSTLASKLGLADVIADKVDLTGRVGGANPASKSLTLIHAMVAGASHIDHVDMLRAGASSKVLPFHVAAPSTLGTYLRSFTFGHVRQLDEVIEAELAKAWSLGMAPGDDPLVIDIDSTICEVSGYHKQGAAYGYTKKLGYHPLLAVRSDTGEVLHQRMRKGSANTQRGTKRFVQELIARCRRIGATGKITIRFDSGYQSDATLKELERLKVSYTMAVHANAKGIKSLVEDISKDCWTPIDYTEASEAQVLTILANEHDPAHYHMLGPCYSTRNQLHRGNYLPPATMRRGTLLNVATSTTFQGSCSRHAMITASPNRLNSKPTLELNLKVGLNSKAMLQSSSQDTSDRKLRSREHERHDQNEQHKGGHDRHRRVILVDEADHTGHHSQNRG